VSFTPTAGLRADYSHDDQVVTLTLDRPERLNAQDPGLWDALTDVQRALPGTVRVAVLRGAGRAFSAGLDRAMFTDPSGLPGLASAPAEQVDEQIARWQQAFDWRSRPALTSIAAVQGHAIGAGFQLALGADIRLAADDVQFCMAEPTLGLVPDLGGTKRLTDLVGYARATDICLTGRRIGAPEAYAMGLANQIVPADGLDAAVDSLVTALLAVDRDAATETKALLLGAAARTQDEQQAAERAAQYRRLRTLLDRPRC
jgi:enoyl-CoA hydratase/carnithine racemase